MATLREYYDTDFARVLNVATNFKFTGNDREFRINGRLHLDFDANATFVSCFVPVDIEPAPTARGVFTDLDHFFKLGRGVATQMGLPGERLRDSSTLRFAGRVFVYHEKEMHEAVEEKLRQEADSLGISLQLRGPLYAAERSKLEHPMAFISHDSRDKDTIARPIALRLSGMMCPVWFDEFSLKVGDRLRDSIERGLREAKKCVLVLTPNFLGNGGWTKTEFDSVFTRELIEREDVILPVWSGVSSGQVYEYSPSLANRLAANWDKDPEAAIKALYRAIK